MWVLILFAHVGAFGKTDSNSITTHEFTSKVTCEAAGKAAKTLVVGSVKDIEFVCVPK